MSKSAANIEIEDEATNSAAVEYLSRKFRKKDPQGRFDNGRRWYPGEKEECDCCSWVRQPSRAWPYSLMVHCRTAEHVANLYDVDRRQLIAIAKIIGSQQG